ncbi:LysM peptidoglycan-binding domain-containing protein [Chlorobaculum sp. MV4-Y]|uniref:CIS tube protein n=1 Tax=Chlorobaculum sp. MV4-Y TaxID=2976335 RepID=UPI0021AEA62A|nr:LysM peptidoglycan-binding domain-containing protein [Chlorobaculum sp. MV4-Y]UWX56711.1 LysM peptidoglycan-binding domain-containing protein [Chlorobaculum sp. MV4-Y]
MAESGKLEKMLILAFADSQQAESGGKKEADDYVEALINPESYTQSYKLKFSKSGQGQGTSGQQLKYEYSEPGEMSFEFLFDNTGIIDGKSRDSITEDIEKFRKVLTDYKGDSHEPRHFKLVWGENSIFKGRVTSLEITFKLFKPDGTPLRATAKVTFKSSIEEEKRAATEDRQSADLTHIRKVRAGDTLPLMCFRIYGDSKYYLDVAAANGLDDFRSLTPGAEIRFPPIDKTAKSS